MKWSSIVLAAFWLCCFAVVAFADGEATTSPVSGLSPVVVTTGINAIAVLSGVLAFLSKLLPIVARGVLALERISQNTEATRDGVDALLRSRGVGADQRRHTTRAPAPKSE